MATTPKSRGEKNRGEEEIWQGREHGREGMARVIWQQRLQRRGKIAVSQRREEVTKGERGKVVKSKTLNISKGLKGEGTYVFLR